MIPAKPNTLTPMRKAIAASILLCFLVAEIVRRVLFAREDGGGKSRRRAVGVLYVWQNVVVGARGGCSVGNAQELCAPFEASD